MYDLPFRQGPAIDTTHTGPDREAKRVYYEKVEAATKKRRQSELISELFFASV